MVANDSPVASTLRYNEKPVYTTSNGCPVQDPESAQRGTPEHPGNVEALADMFLL